YLARQFYDHSIERTYVALIWGELKSDEGTVNASLGRSPKDRRLITVYPENEGRNAITHYRVLEKLHYVSLITCKLETGRTHQIRVHMQHLGHPIFNDASYGGDKILKGTVFTKYKQFIDNCFKIMPRQALHAKSLGFKHPRTQEWMQFDSELPEDFTALLDKWRHYAHYSNQTE
ncbi:MAG: RNA pseudouridine synthase, partial [Verrucomicrobia bacterium]|nr:RNA pseudouridine synthase [Cytophagales bacterium]